MFSPIKSLITYIQKNASGSNFFGGTSSNTKLSDDPTMESELVNTNFDTNQQPALTELEPVNDKNHDQNENVVFEDCTAVTESTTADDPLMINGDEEEKDIFLDFPIATQNDESDVEFAANEVVVLDNPDLNNSVASDPGIDPLAIDDYPNHADGVSPLRLDSSVNGDVLFMGPVDDIEVKSVQMTEEGVSENDRIMAAVKAADEQEIRSDGSDSGLGSETSALQSTVTSIADTSTCSTASCSTPIVKKIPLRSNLKRRLQDVVVDGEDQIQKKARKSINFDGVKVFYFPRIQGHGCVPSQGGCTLGMGAHHISFKTFSLAEHAAELRRAHKLQLQEINPRGSSSEESDSDEELSEGSGSDLDADTNGFLQPVSPKQRRALLKAAGVRKIDPSEKIECRDIRNSREVCGCVCRDFCDPDTCACSQAGIKCQVDRAMFPCGCSRDACGNVIGRIEFNPARVRTHFIHTIMRLDMENRQQKRPDELVASASHLMYSSVPAIANGPTAINSYNTIPSYGMEQSPSAVPHGYHHHMHPQHNVYMNHIPPAHPVGSIYGAPMGIEAPTTSLPLQQTHSHYVTSAGVEPDGIAGSLHYQDGPLYPPVHAAPLAPPVTAVYGDILAPYATSTPYHSVHAIDNSYPTNVYTSYHNPHHHQNHSMVHQQPLLGFAPACSGDLNEYNDSQSSFINLNTPEASSSRLSAINDLLHNNRNTTAALVAVSPVTSEAADAIAAVSCVILQVQELPNSSPDRDVIEGAQKEEQEKEETLAESSAEEKEEEKQTDSNASPKLPQDENPLEPSKSANITIETTETAKEEQKEIDQAPSDPPPPKQSEDVPTPITEESKTESITQPTEPVVEADAPVNPATESEDERITDILPPPPIVETVSA